jgi:hypothetical protein
MQKLVFFVTLFFVLSLGFTQNDSSFKKGEWLKFKLSYSGWMKAGYATLEVDEEIYKDQAVYSLNGKGWTTGAIKFFFKVKDHYSSYVDKELGVPYLFKRKIYEGGYKKNLEIKFDQAKNKAHIQDKIKGTSTLVDTKQNIQDLLSSFYYLRNNYDTASMSKGDVLFFDVFFDGENHNFKLTFLGRQTIKTKFGSIKCLLFRPSVLAGRVFKKDESLTIWISADKNRVPLKIKADLAVGSLRADLIAQKGLKYPFEIQF